MKEEAVRRIVEEVLRNTHPTAPVAPCGMSLSLANALIDRVKARAKAMGISVVVAVSDEKAIPVSVQCMEGAYIGSFDVALQKTFTAVGFQMSTERLGGLAKPGEALYGIQYTNGGRVVIIGGGEPLYHQGALVGAIGVSGGSAKEDTDLATYAKDVFKEVVMCL